MSLFFAIGNTFFGIYILLIGFKKVRPSKKVSEDELEAWHNKYGRWMKIGGILVLTIGLHSLFKNLS